MATYFYHEGITSSYGLREPRKGGFGCFAEADSKEEAIAKFDALITGMRQKEIVLDDGSSVELCSTMALGPIPPEGFVGFYQKGQVCVAFTHLRPVGATLAAKEVPHV